MLMLLCCSYFAVASPSTYQSLAGINRYWLAQEDVQQDRLPEYMKRTGKEWIRLHLSLVEQTLRNRSVTGLSVQQQQRRRTALNHLHQYWQAGNFPLNEQYSYRTPIFIDPHDNFCAVGYLVKATGHEAVSRTIASRSNLAYVMDMQYPELDVWANDYGFTKEELAWIQPTYAPDHYLAPLGKADGIVTYQNAQANAVAWSAAMGFMPFANDLANSVNDFTVFNGKVYAGCERINATDNSLVLLQLDNDEWKPVSKVDDADTFWPSPINNKVSINTLLVEGNTMLAGGCFYSTDYMYWAVNCAEVTPDPYPCEQKFFFAEDAVNKMTWFKGDLIAAGSFNVRGTNGDTSVVSKGIARRVSMTTGITGQIMALSSLSTLTP